MSIHCESCGAELPEDARFCGECGASARSDPPPDPYGYSYAEPAVNRRPVTGYSGYDPPAPVPAGTGHISTAEFFFTLLLFAIPVIGLIACLIMSFAPKLPTRRHFARALLIWNIIGCILGVSVGAFAYLKDEASSDLVRVRIMGQELGSMSSFEAVVPTSAPELLSEQLEPPQSFEITIDR
ncbi:MAG: zinc ribbon domain-containing protein [Clostridiales bacterium]|jgi:hypothetical protein|nr:zinc ribbon domain-containing protein [Clostridiales bacterium]